MFPAFTGSARPKRQVNLSGRNANPFAAHANPRTSSLVQHNSQTALAHAQKERIIRQQERDRPPAALKIQKTWRGHRGRKITRDRWRHEWDLEEGWIDAAHPEQSYTSIKECLTQLRLLVQFVGSRPDADDLYRLWHFSQRYLRTRAAGILVEGNDTTYPVFHLARLTIRALRAASTPASTLSPRIPSALASGLLHLLQDLAHFIPLLLAHYSSEYYDALASAMRGPCRDDPTAVQGPVLALLGKSDEISAFAYAGFVKEFLTLPNIPGSFGGLDFLDGIVQYEFVAESLHNALSNSSGSSLFESKPHDQLLWLLAYFIHFRRHWYLSQSIVSTVPDTQYVRIVSVLVSFLANDIASRVDTVQFSANSEESETSHSHPEPLPHFVQSEISNLISQEDVSGLLATLDISTSSGTEAGESSAEASILASYALMLLRVFKRRGDDIRMWLYRGSTSTQSKKTHASVPAVKFFYQATKSTTVFQDISQDPRATIRLMKSETEEDMSRNQASQKLTNTRDQQWRIILLFLELYTFPLKIMDDEEFLSNTSPSAGQSWTRASALPLDQIQELTIFLKNLAFSLYWYSSEMMGIDEYEPATSLADYFGRVDNSRTQNSSRAKPKGLTIAGVKGLSLDYVKGLVTGVLRMIYERDSRRKFLPRGHWLMTRYFEMDRFISAVVKEEEEKYKIEQSYGNEPDETMAEDEQESADEPLLVGTSHTLQIRNAERLKRQQRQDSRKKYLRSVTPRLEILQNMPFFIPFETRVEIFREFVMMDQVIRRGTADADEWRFAQINSPNGTISRHRAKVRRKNIFDDAFEQFYELGDGLKEPIQIRFVDEFDTVEEGIDGGGVTKEFLTSITSEAFGAENGLESLFVENDQHLLYPNPSAVEERKESLRQALYKEGSLDWNDNVRDLLRRYEFLGRIIGKCLYEGILVDLHFAPFFLLKWALTGGSGSAAKESGYRANLNDLRDLDEGLYQGLLQLKNHSGNVEDFSLDFTVTDNLKLSPTDVKAVTRELRPNGASVSVNNENRLVYISYMARYRLQVQPHLQTSAFLRGLGTIVSTSWLNMFNQSELQTLVSGTTTEVNIPDLRANTQYGGVYAIGDDGLEHPSIQLFWKVMQNLSDTERKKVLKFVTSTPRAPLLGFRNLNPRFSIRDSGGDQTRLPSTSTCVNLLKLPIYRDESVLKERLLYSVNSGAGFNLS